MKGLYIPCASVCGVNDIRKCEKWLGNKRFPA
jgi:hypothetical protein